MKPSGYRSINGARERLCHLCARWLPHDAAHFYDRANQLFGLRTTCKECMRAAQLPQNLARQRAIIKRHQEQRQFARAAAEGRIR